MVEWLSSIPIILLAFIVGCFCWFCTSSGSAMVFFCKNLNEKYMSALLASAGGIMIASSFFSLLIPALEMCENIILHKILFVVGGFILGGLFIAFTNYYFDKKFSPHFNNKNKHKRAFLLTASITLHNIPEGMAVGVALGSVLVSGDQSLLLPAIMLGIGIGIQNIPEGASVSIPLKRDGMKTSKAFFRGVLSGSVEPIFATLACLMSVFISSILPLFLSFAAGAMLLVSLSEIIPESLQTNKLLSIIFFIIGFSFMAIFDTVI